LIGLAHDLGKYSEAFQQYLEKVANRRDNSNANVPIQVGFVQKIRGTEGAGAQKSLKVPQTADVEKSADIAFEIGCQVRVIERYQVDIRVGVELWEAAPHDGCFDPPG
jgi:hypothetical protein